MAGVKGKGGVKGKSGRKPSLDKLIKDDIKERQAHIPTYFDALEVVALGGQNVCPNCEYKFGYKSPDREALEYLIDRNMGKPTVKSVMELQGDLTLTNYNIREIWLELVEFEKGMMLAMRERIGYLENVLTEAHIPFEEDKGIIEGEVITSKVGEYLTQGNSQEAIISGDKPDGI